MHFMIAIRAACGRSLSLASILLLPVGALAALPPVLDVVPRGTPSVIAIESIEKLDRDLGQLLGAIEAPPMTIGQALTGMGLAEGLDMAGSFGAVWVDVKAAPGKEGEASAEDHLVILLPMKDSAAFLKSLGAKEANGVQKIDYNGQAYFGRTVDGGFMALSARAETLAAFKGGKGNLKTYKDSLGAQGLAIAESAGIVALGDPAEGAKLLDEAMGALKNGMGGMPVPGMEAFGAGNADRLKAMMKDVDVGMVTFSPSGLGLKVDLFAGFKPDTKSAKLFDDAGSEAGQGAMAGLPQGDFIVAGGMNMKHPAIKAWLAETREAADAAKKADGSAAGVAPSWGELLGKVLAAAEKSDRFSVGVFTPAGPMMVAGALTQTVIGWKAADPVAVAGAFRAAVEAMKPKEGEEAASPVIVAYGPGAFKSGEQSFDTWSVTPKLGAEGAAMSPNPVLFGQQPGVRGYVAVAKDRGFITTSRDQAFMDRALAGEKTLADDQAIKQVGAMLPKNPAMEGYFLPKSVLNQFGPLLTMATGVKLDVPDNLPPIGGAVAMHGGTMHAGLFVPAPVLKIGVGAAMGAQQAAARREPAPTNHSEPPAQAPAEGKPNGGGSR